MSLKQDMLDDMRMATLLAKEAAPHGSVPLIGPFFTEIRSIRSDHLAYNTLRHEMLNDVPESSPS